MFKKRLVLTVLSAIIMASTPTAKASSTPVIAPGFDDLYTVNESTWESVDIASFEPSEGDYMVADTDKGVGYLINDKTLKYASFDLLSGQKRYVSYIGRYYYAATPLRDWVVKSKEIKGDRVTFGANGRFLRLFADGKGTPYGIHNYKYFDYSVSKGEKYISFGCLLVADNVLNVIVKSFEANDGELKVKTTTDEQILPFWKPVF